MIGSADGTLADYGDAAAAGKREEVGDLVTLYFPGNVILRIFSFIANKILGEKLSFHDDELDPDPDPDPDPDLDLDPFRRKKGQVSRWSTVIVQTKGTLRNKETLAGYGTRRTHMAIWTPYAILFHQIIFIFSLLLFTFPFFLFRKTFYILTYS